LKNIFTDSKIADLSLNRRKCKNVIQVIAKRENEEIISNLQSKFSILIDESTDITDSKNMCVLVRYISSKKLKN